MTSLTYAALRDALDKPTAGIRSNTDLQPLGGADDKVFPPTYGVADNAATKYAVETRVVNDERVDSVVLDSVASQANRMELALLEAVEFRDLNLPYAYVDFSDTAVPDLDRLTTLQAPHRIFDAIFRDSLLDDTLFRLTPLGQAITEATPNSAAALLRWAPTALLFGAWDSTGPKGGRGSKFERAITAELVANGIAQGVKTGSRLDPAGIELSAGPILEANDPEQVWTLNPDEAVLDLKTKQPLPLAGGGDGKAGRPSQINHGNVTPSIDEKAGGITAQSITGTTVISFAQLRRLRFPVTTDGQRLEGKARRAAEQAAHAALAALGIAAHTLAAEAGYDLRSRCVLVPTSQPSLQLIGRTLDDITTVECSSDDAIALVNEAAGAVVEAGLAWDSQPTRLTPTAKLVDLVARSRDLSAKKNVEDDS